ncbi:MAG: NAD-binding protein [Streptosporangiales bacterium]|nr:NAD-binding protein [Streptosporangiales bacterium]
MSDTIGLFGLGNMGDAVAARLAAHGPVIGYDPDSGRATEAAGKHGIRLAADLAEVAAAVGTVVLSLPTPAISARVVADLAPRLAAGSMIVETSTVNPSDVQALGALAEPYGVRLIDAAILSGVKQMYEGTSMLLIGGADADVAAAAPVLDALAARQKHFGPLGSGMAAKVINNAVAHAVMVVLVEAGSMARATGVSGHDLVELLIGEDAGLTRPLTHRFAERVLRGEYDGGMPTEAARKDSTLALGLAQDAEIPLFAIQAAHSVYELGLAEGLGRSDYASIARLWERWTGRPLHE